MNIQISATEPRKNTKRPAEEVSQSPLFHTKKDRRTSPGQTNATTNPHKGLPPARAASSSTGIVSTQGLNAEKLRMLRTSGMALIEKVVDEKAVHTSQTEAYSKTIIDSDSDHDETDSQRKNPSSQTPHYAIGDILRPISDVSTPGRSRHLVAANQSSATITEDLLGTGGDTSAFSAIFTSPGMTKYPAAAIYTMNPPKTVYPRAKDFGHLATFHLGEMDYVSLTLKGTTLKDATQRLIDDPAAEKYKLAFLLTQFPHILEKLSLIEASGHAHEDIKPENLVIWHHDNAGPIDMRALPKIGDRKRTFSKDYTSPGKQLIRTASSSSDAFAIGRSISIGFRVFERAFSEIPGLTTLLTDLEKDRTNRPGLDSIKARIEQSLADCRAQDGNYATELAKVESRFFEGLDPEKSPLT